jgi:hypothetical protein
MTRLPVSPAAAALFRTLVARAGVARDRILLSDVESVDWQSLTFSGERHCFDLRVPAPDSRAIAERLCDGLEDAEFSMVGIIVADISISARPQFALDGSTRLSVEALTISAD